ncbi:TPA: hypothetical protein ACWW69_002515 [Klebsiella pneumoniae]
MKHKSGTVLFVTNCERTANNRREMGWLVEELTAIERLAKINEDNKRVVTVSIGVLKAALSEIRAHVAMNGEGLMTRAVIRALEGNINK